MWNPGDDPSVLTWRITPALETEAFFRDVYWLAAEGRTNVHGSPGLTDLAWVVPSAGTRFALLAHPQLSSGFCLPFFDHLGISVVGGPTHPGQPPNPSLRRTRAKDAT